MSKLIGRQGVRRGFTMIELLTVIGIICILMAILIPVISTMRQISQKTDTTHFITKIATACQNYYQEFRGYPGPLADTAVHGFGLDMSSDTPGTPSAGFAAAINPSAYSNGTAGATTFKDVTSSQNLLLGLLGGLTFNAASSPIPIEYDIALMTKGPQILNTLAAQQLPTYLEVTKYDISSDGIGNYGSKAPMGGMSPCGHMYASAGPPPTYLLPEFMDHYAEPHPIIYLRARAGATYACDIAPGAASAGALASLGSQYYSAEMAPYAPDFFQQQDHYNNFTTAFTGQPSANGYGITFFQNQALNSTVGSASTGGNSVARGQDSFILMSAGYDGLYGTKDDVVYPSN